MSETPGWFKRAIETPFVNNNIEVDGVNIHYLSWGDDADKPGLVFVHGNGAHAHWWTFIAPFFLVQGIVVTRIAIQRRVLRLKLQPSQMMLASAMTPLSSDIVSVDSLRSRPACSMRINCRALCLSTLRSDRRTFSGKEIPDVHRLSQSGFTIPMRQRIADFD